jgi:hypothetical protein
MNSLTLKEKGFADFVALKGLAFSSLPDDKSVVLAIADSSLSGKPTSDILYIGRSKKPAKRIFGGYLAGYGGKTTKKINSKLLDEGYIEKATVSWMVSEEPKTAQEMLLKDFNKEHGSYPAWNDLKKVAEKMKTQTAPKTARKRPARKNTKPAKPAP